MLYIFAFHNYFPLETINSDVILKEEETYFQKDLKFFQNNFFSWKHSRIFYMNIFFKGRLFNDTNYDPDFSYAKRYSIIENYKQYIIYKNKFGCNENLSEVRSGFRNQFYPK